MNHKEFPDIYFRPEYGQLYKKIETGKVEIFDFYSSLGHIYYQFIKRPIDILIDERRYYDIVTPYGYGGPLILKCVEGEKNNLIQEFKVEFQKYCIKNNIVSEFVRFHPILGNAKDFESSYKVENIRKTVGTNLAAFDDPFQSEFSKSCRKNVRKALNNGVNYKVAQNPSVKSLKKFKEIYYSTMDRNEAGDYYYFDDDYFNNCVELFSEHLLLVEAIHNQKTVAMGLYFIYNKIIHIHLSGTLSEFLHLSPAYILRYAVTKWGKEKGYKIIHHGGGRGNSPEDNLYLFKKQFGKNTEFEFYVGKKIWNNKAYNLLCEKQKINAKAEFFPAYRNNI